MDINLEKLNEALGTWMDISNRINEIEFRHNDLLNSLKSFIKDVKEIQLARIEYLIEVLEYLQEIAEQQEDKEGIRQYQKVISELNELPKKVETIREQVQGIIDFDDYDWLVIMDNIEILAQYRSNIDVIAAKVLGIYQYLLGE